MAFLSCTAAQKSCQSTWSPKPVRCGGTIAWPPRSPDLTPHGFDLWGQVKDKVFVPPLPASLEELRARITEAVATIDVDMIHRIWEEIVYGWDICRVTRENHIEQL